MSIPGIRRNDKRITQFVTDITKTLQSGNKHQTTGLGTFSTCTRKAAGGKPTCTITMFRPSKEFRDYMSGGAMPKMDGPHKEVVKIITKSIKSASELEVPKLGVFCIDSSGENTRITFQGTIELNSSL